MASKPINTVPLSSIVKAAALDLREDYTKTKATLRSLALRSLRELTQNSARQVARRAIININKKLYTAPIPDCAKGIVSVFLLDDCGKKYPLTNNSNLVPKETEEFGCIEKCESCNQDKDICEQLQVDVSRETITINSTQKEKVITRYFENGLYYEVVNTWTYDHKTSTIIPYKYKNFLDSFDMLSCGCIAPTEKNISKIKNCCSDCYNSCYTTCENFEHSYGGYRVYIEDGFIQFAIGCPLNKVYIEYTTELPKIDGEFHVPEVAQFALIAAVKCYYQNDRNSVTLGEKQRLKMDRDEKVKNMVKVLTRISLSDLLNTLNNR